MGVFLYNQDRNYQKCLDNPTWKSYAEKYENWLVETFCNKNDVAGIEAYVFKNKAGTRTDIAGTYFKKDFRELSGARCIALAIHMGQDVVVYMLHFLSHNDYDTQFTYAMRSGNHTPINIDTVQHFIIEQKELQKEPPVERLEMTSQERNMLYLTNDESRCEMVFESQQWKAGMDVICRNLADRMKDLAEDIATEMLDAFDKNTCTIVKKKFGRYYYGFFIW